jgi:hypothetical protein
VSGWAESSQVGGPRSTRRNALTQMTAGTGLVRTDDAIRRQAAGLHQSACG